VNVCARCQAINPASERRCLSCGAELRVGASEASCPRGHPIDPSWAACPYCALQGVASPLAAAAPPAAKPPRQPEPPPVPPEPRPAIERPERSVAMRCTRLAAARPPPLPAPTAAAVPAAEQTAAVSSPAHEEGARALVAVLAAPALRPGGAVFAVHQGKSFLGAHPSNDVCLGEDPQVSSEHAVLLARNGRFFLADRMSSNSTWLNGAEVEAGGQTELHDRDRIRCGATELVLLVLPTP
jgi:hypothetical protein